MVVAFGVALASLGTCVSVLFWKGLVDAGSRELEYRDTLRADPVRESPDVPLAVFLGDSTFLPSYAYPHQLARLLAGKAEIQTFWWKGFEPFHHYLLVGHVMDQGPKIVVVVAQLRVFWRHEPLWYEDLLTMVPPRELPRAVLLPFHERSVSIPRLVLASLLGSTGEGGEDLLRVFVGGRKRAATLPGLRWLVPHRAPIADPRRLTQLREERFESYDRPIDPAHPAVRALAATVEQAVRRGARTLVLMSPVPTEALADAGLYDPEVFAGRVQVIADAVEGEGGELLDLHAILREGDFTDHLGHMSRSGAWKVTTALGPWMRRALSELER
jgi:hypothetical protein